MGRMAEAGFQSVSQLFVIPQGVCDGDEEK